jgi:H+/Cl- antiporter ClcA
VLFSGQDQLPGVLAHAGGWSVGALVALIACKALAYALSLSSFRGGPVFPALFVGAVLGMACANLPGLGLIPGVAMGIGAMCVGMLGLPLTSALLPTLLLGADGVQALPVVIVAVVVAYVAGARLAPPPEPAPEPAPVPDHPIGMMNPRGRDATLAS